MKKSYLMIAVAAMAMTACTENEMQKEIQNDQAIDFGTFVQKATRAENSGENYTWQLEDHHKTFNVYGYKNTSATAVFNNETVTNNGTDWAYEGKRYWDKAATLYCFYAYAPANADLFKFNGVSGINTQKNGYFTIESHTVTGANIASASGDADITQSFASGDPDKDLMIAEKCERVIEGKSTDFETVNLNFIHILSRLNIAVQADKDKFEFDASGEASGDYVTLKEISFGHMAESGAFDESSASGDALASGSAIRWTKTAQDKDFKYEFERKLKNNYLYFVETLVMPQEAGKESIKLDGTEVTANTESYPWIKIRYTITNSKNTEEFVAYYNLATVFNIADDKTLAFNEGWQNTLKITISPAVIEFDGSVAPWDDNLTEELTVK